MLRLCVHLKPQFVVKQAVLVTICELTLAGNLAIHLAYIQRKNAPSHDSLLGRELTMSPIEQAQLFINEFLGQVLHAGSSTSSTIALGLGMF
ncbi:hypothetical protein CCYS_01770 [Corynebacterium cystitidis DSM 20524]|uniref:Uncharacterized protein n=1 Tax=Corynebacterium cystitidis DSM 20524 TaxID=1121357 RepID=A0A1H9VZX6_9CORY|nr:hypothetical protein CCYS_01770 [Corynebacterium cystitidis DSM 20524]SES26823.1 hypothetical protein SAMN05661109_02455 [Corynebacterium cystitidis DSM 20524]SNV88357.1 Uncharacterised protein [Corynebacterium cystitidis]